MLAPAVTNLFVLSDSPRLRRRCLTAAAAQEVATLPRHAGTALLPAAFLVGFGAEELPVLRAAWTGVDVYRADGAPCASALLRGEAPQERRSDEGSAPSSGGRCVLLHGVAAAAAGALKPTLLAAGLRPAVFGPLPSLASPFPPAVASLLTSHDALWALRVPVPTASTSWAPHRCSAPLRLRLSAGDAAPSPPGHVAVVDGLVDEPLRAALLAELTGSPTAAPAASHARAAAPAPPNNGKWERETRDVGGKGKPTWGLTADAIAELHTPRRSPPCFVELCSRIALLYPLYDVCLMPGHAMQLQGCAAVAPVVGNAAVFGDAFSWHRDAQPHALARDSPWAERFGTAPARCGGSASPLLVSLVVYLNDVWKRDWEGDTLFIDTSLGAGVFVQPRPGRCLLMDQDLLHRLSAPAKKAARPRYSFVLKLALFEKHPQPGGAGPTLARSEWGGPGQLFGDG